MAKTFRALRIISFHPEWLQYLRKREISYKQNNDNENVDGTHALETTQVSSALLVALAMFQTMKYIPQTFGERAVKILQMILNCAKLQMQKS